MGNRHPYQFEYLHTLGASESERLKVTALNLFDPNASIPFQDVSYWVQPLNHKGEKC